jgi:hypothetical protein
MLVVVMLLAQRASAEICLVTCPTGFTLDYTT